VRRHAFATDSCSNPTLLLPITGACAGSPPFIAALELPVRTAGGLEVRQRSAVLLLAKAGSSSLRDDRHRRPVCRRGAGVSDLLDATTRRGRFGPKSQLQPAQRRADPGPVRETVCVTPLIAWRVVPGKAALLRDLGNPRCALSEAPAVVSMIRRSRWLAARQEDLRARCHSKVERVRHRLDHHAMSGHETSCPCCNVARVCNRSPKPRLKGVHPG